MAVWYSTLTHTPDDTYDLDEDYPNRGEKPNNSSSTMIGNEVKTVTVNFIRKNSATGNVTAEVRDLTNNDLKLTIGSAFDISTIDNDTKTEHTFTGTTGYTLTENDTVTFHFDNPDGTKIVQIFRSTDDAYDGANSGRSSYSSASSAWDTGDNTADLLATIDSTGTTPTSTGTRLPPPPIVLGGL